MAVWKAFKKNSPHLKDQKVHLEVDQKYRSGTPRTVPEIM